MDNQINSLRVTIGGQINEKDDSGNVNTDTKAYGISCTNAWNKFTMAHETGRNFGANRVAVKWYQI